MSALARPLLVTLGDPRGIGPEITLKAWNALRTGNTCFAAIGPMQFYELVAKALGLAAPISVARLSDAGAAFPNGLPVMNIVPQSDGPRSLTPTQHIVASISDAVALCRSGDASGVVTNPIHKRSLYDAGFAFPGHTEYLAHLTGAPAAIMMLAIDGLRVVPVTVHQSVTDAIQSLTQEKIVSAARIVARELTVKFAVDRPKLAVAALNPHAGEDGALGQEEKTIIAPAIAALRAEGLDVSGPYPVDTLFHPAARKRYDAALCMLHDHALLPIKTLDFDRGVNVTLGLPIIRTSPDHGTAFDIAGRGIANPASLIAAIQLATQLAKTTT